MKQALIKLFAEQALPEKTFSMEGHTLLATFEDHDLNDIVVSIKDIDHLISYSKYVSGDTREWRIVYLTTKDKLETIHLRLRLYSEADVAIVMDLLRQQIIKKKKMGLFLELIKSHPAFSAEEVWEKVNQAWELITEQEAQWVV